MGAPRVVDVRAELPSEEALAGVVRHVLGGGLIAYPTETVYGFGGLAALRAVESLRRLKPGRERPFLLLVPSVAAVSQLAWTAEARALASAFWPGALTLVLADPSGSFPAGVRGKRGGVAVRVTSHALTRRLVQRLGRAITSTSANLPGEPPAADGQEALAAASRTAAAEEFWVLDGGPLPASLPSTVVDCTGPLPRIERPGAIPEARLHAVLSEIDGEP